MAEKNIAQADPLKEVEEIRRRAVTVFGSTSDSDAWLAQPREEFDNCAAVDLLHTDLGRELVKLALTRMESETAERELDMKGCETTLRKRAAFNVDINRPISA